MLLTTAAVRGIIPLIDPALDGAAQANAASVISQDQPLNAGGQSVADLLTGIGFVHFTPQAPAGGAGPTAGTKSVDAGNDSDSANDSDDHAGDAGNVAAVCPPAVAVAVTASASVATNVDNNVGNQKNRNKKNASATKEAPAAGVASNASNFQTFASAIDAPAEPKAFSGNPTRPFEVAGSTFVNFAPAAV